MRPSLCCEGCRTVEVRTCSTALQEHWSIAMMLCRPLRFYEMARVWLPQRVSCSQNIRTASAHWVVWVTFCKTTYGRFWIDDELELLHAPALIYMIGRQPPALANCISWKRMCFWICLVMLMFSLLFTSLLLLLWSFLNFDAISGHCGWCRIVPLHVRCSWSALVRLRLSIVYGSISPMLDSGWLCPHSTRKCAFDWSEMVGALWIIEESSKQILTIVHAGNRRMFIWRINAQATILLGDCMSSNREQCCSELFSVSAWVLCDV